eukprot:11444710-Ditylum_brightwellii.AAC.1
MRATPREEGSAKSNTKLAKRLTVTGTENPHDVIPMAKDITIASAMGIATTPWKSVGSPSTGARDACAIKGRQILQQQEDLHAIINEKIAAVLDCKEKKDINKFEALSILSNSNMNDGSNSNSR